MYTKHHSYVNDAEDGTPDIIHFHNKFYDTDAKSVIQYHSPPFNNYIRVGFPGKKLVVAQYQATLAEYIKMNCIPMRNIINFEQKISSTFA